MRADNRNDTLVLLFYLFIRQMGSLADCFRHVQKDNLLYTEELEGWSGHIKTELSDVVMLVRKTCKLFGFDFDEVDKMGQTRDAEKGEEYLRRHPGSFWT